MKNLLFLSSSFLLLAACAGGKASAPGTPAGGDGAAEILSTPLSGKLQGKAFSVKRAFATRANGQITLTFAGDTATGCQSPQGSYIGANAPEKPGVFRTDMTNPKDGDHFDSTVQVISGGASSPSIDVMPKSVIQISKITAAAVEGGLSASGQGTEVNGRFEAKFCDNGSPQPTPRPDPYAKFIEGLVGTYLGNAVMKSGDLVFNRYMKLTVSHQSTAGENRLHIDVRDDHSDGSYWSTSLVAKDDTLFSTCSRTGQLVNVGRYSTTSGEIRYNAMKADCTLTDEYVYIRRIAERELAVDAHRIQLVPGTSSRYQNHDFRGDRLGKR